MIKSRFIAIFLTTMGILSIATLGIASAATPTSTTVGTSGIPRSTFKADRLSAAAEVLNTTTANVQAAHKDKTFSGLMTNAGLTKKTFAEKLKTQLTTELEGQGYSQDQVTIALQHRYIARLHHYDKHHK
jgi:hypothetical protein